MSEDAEITQDMIAAGMAELEAYDRRFDEPGEVVSRIYIAMRLALESGAKDPSPVS